jgi:hypothetical protein
LKSGQEIIAVAGAKSQGQSPEGSEQTPPWQTIWPSSLGAFLAGALDAHVLGALFLGAALEADLAAGLALALVADLAGALGASLAATLVAFGAAGFWRPQALALGAGVSGASALAADLVGALTAVFLAVALAALGAGLAVFGAGFALSDEAVGVLTIFTPPAKGEICFILP